MKKIVIMGTLTFLSLLTAAFVAGAGSGSASIDRTVVSGFSLNDFMGRWYEIARFDHSFERGMDYVTADYTLLEDGTVEVINRGVRDGEPQMAEGRAKTTDTPGHLRVSFFWIFYSDYNVLAMGDNGEWALIGSKSPKYLWIMSRTPRLEPDLLKKALDTASARGYDTSKLIYVEQR